MKKTQVKMLWKKFKVAGSLLVLLVLLGGVIEAEDEFGKVAGGIRYWVKDCFLPALEKRNLRIWKLEEKKNAEGT